MDGSSFATPLPHAPRSKRGSHGEPWRVAVVMPGYNKHNDVKLLLEDLVRLDVRGIDMWCVLVDNCSKPALSTIPVPQGLRVEHLRLETNTGGAGGFNAGMAHVLRGEGSSAHFAKPDFIWCLDSDARVSKKSLRHLLVAMIQHKKLCAVGSALTDTKMGYVYEVGGVISRDKGEWCPAGAAFADRRTLIEADYLAACSLLVRREAIEQTGLMPDIFIHGDDVQWTVSMCKKTGMKVAGVPKSKIYHPHFIYKFQSWTRYYGCRNSFAAIDLMGLGGRVRFRKAIVEMKRAVAQAMMGMDELAEMHIQGIEDAAAGKTVGHHPKPSREAVMAAAKPKPFKQLRTELPELLAKHGGGDPKQASLFIHDLLLAHPVDLADLKAELKAMGHKTKASPYWKKRDRATFLASDAFKAMGRFLFGPTADVAIVPTGWPTSWFRGSTLIQVTPDGYLVREVTRLGRVGAALKMISRGVLGAIKLGVAPPTWHTLPPAPARVTPIPATRAPSVVEPKPKHPEPAIA
jgi:GT2 family glycosyltransferase